MQRSGRRLSELLLAALIMSLPLPRHWLLWEYVFPDVYHEYTSLSFYLSDAANLLFLASSAFWLNWRQTRELEQKPFTYPLLFLVVWTAVSGIWAFDLSLTVQMSLRLLILMTTTAAIMRLRPDHRVIQFSLALSLLVQAIVAIAQFAMQDDLGLRWLGEIDIHRYPGGGSILVAEQQYWLRGYGLTPHPNILGGVAALLILSLIIPYLESRPRHRPLWLVILLTGATGLFYSFSRAAWLGAAVGGLYLVTAIGFRRSWRRQYGRALMMLGLSFGVLLAALSWQQRPLVLARFNPASSEQEARSITERSTLLEAGKNLVSLAPLTGVGAKNSSVLLIPYVREQSNAVPQPIHNMVILLTVELGVIGGSLWLWLMVAPMAISLHRLHQGRLTLWSLGLTAALVAFAVIDLFDFYAWGWTQGRLLRWVYWGLWLASLRVER